MEAESEFFLHSHSFGPFFPNNLPFTWDLKIHAPTLHYRIKSPFRPSFIHPFPEPKPIEGEKEGEKTLLHCKVHCKVLYENTKSKQKRRSLTSSLLLSGSSQDLNHVRLRVFSHEITFYFYGKGNHGSRPDTERYGSRAPSISH